MSNSISEISTVSKMEPLSDETLPTEVEQKVSQIAADSIKEPTTKTSTNLSERVKAKPTTISIDEAEMLQEISKGRMRGSCPDLYERLKKGEQLDIEFVKKIVHNMNNKGEGLDYSFCFLTRILQNGQLLDTEAIDYLISLLDSEEGALVNKALYLLRRCIANKQHIEGSMIEKVFNLLANDSISLEEDGNYPRFMPNSSQYTHLFVKSRTKALNKFFLTWIQTGHELDSDIINQVIPLLDSPKQPHVAESATWILKGWIISGKSLDKSTINQVISLLDSPALHVRISAFKILAALFFKADYGISGDLIKKIINLQDPKEPSYINNKNMEKYKTFQHGFTHTWVKAWLARGNKF